MKILGLWIMCLCTFLLPGLALGKNTKEIRSGEIWPDNQGVHVNAHGGGVLYHKGTYYWYGENKSDTTSSAMVGIMCYSSRNLYDWKKKELHCPLFWMIHLVILRKDVLWNVQK